MCIQRRRCLFVESSLVNVFVGFLKQVAEKHTFRAIYCFMPDHLHLICMGYEDRSDVLSGAGDFKQITGYWLSSRHLNLEWQDSFYDRIIRRPEELGQKVRYVLENPVRAGLVAEWRDYPFTGAIGFDLEVFLEELAPY